jgi:hypothetical protein
VRNSPGEAEALPGLSYFLAMGFECLETSLFLRA